MFVSVIVLAAGEGLRMGGAVRKQFIELGCRPILAHTLDVFEGCAAVSEIVLVVSGETREYCRRDIVERFEYSKVKCIASGGKDRQASVYNGVKQVASQADVVLVHDGVRPFVTEGVILGCIEEAAAYGCCTVAVRLKDSIKECAGDGFVKSSLARESLWAIQTPQGFRAGVLKEAHELALKDNFSGTDDSVLAERAGYKVKLLEGRYDNIKITTEDDLVYAQYLLQERVK